MKRISIFAFFSFLLFSISVSAEESVVWGSYYMPGNISAEVNLGYESGSLDGGGSVTALALIPEAEMILYKPSFGEIAPIDFGVAARGHLGIGFSDDTLDSKASAGVGILGTFHLGFRGIGSYFTDMSKPAFFSELDKFDYFAEVGLVFDLSTYDDRSRIGFAASSGFNYFLDDHLAITLAGTVWNGMYGGSVGATYKIGPSPDIRQLVIDTSKTKKAGLALDSMSSQMYLSQFYAIYWYSFYAGGFYFDDSNYKEGQGTEWKIVSSDNKDKLFIERNLLKVNSNGSRWWKIKYSSGSDKIVYEFLVDGENNLLKIRYRDSNSGDVREYIAKPEDLKKYNIAKMREMSADDYKEYSGGIVPVTTGAGTFDAQNLMYDDPETNSSYEWWVVNHIPGKLVKFTWKSKEDSKSGELMSISSGNKTELSSF